MMQKSKTMKPQNGFFDLGLSLLILAVSGTAALSINHVQDKKAALQQQEAQMAENDKSARHELFSLDEVDDQLAASKANYCEPSGVSNVLSADTIASMMKEKSA